jgi:hypothetical protein
MQFLVVDVEICLIHACSIDAKQYIKYKANTNEYKQV